MAVKQYYVNNINIKKAVILISISSLSLSIMSLFVKFVSHHTTTNIILFFRFAISYIYILIRFFIQRLNGNKISLKVNNPLLHIIRSTFALTTLSLFMYSLSYIEIMNTTILSLTNTLFVPIIGILILGIKTRVYVILAIIMGFIGTIFVIHPTYGVFDFHSLFALASGFSSACSFLMLREISKKDKAEVTMFYYFLFALILCTITTLFSWHTPLLKTILLLIGSGIFGTIFQECLIRASAYAPASITAPLFYMSIVFSGIFDWLFLKVIPQASEIFGIIMIILSSIIVIKFGAPKSKLIPELT